MKRRARVFRSKCIGILLNLLEQVREEYWEKASQNALDRKCRRRICGTWTE